MSIKKKRREIPAYGFEFNGRMFFGANCSLHIYKQQNKVVFLYIFSCLCCAYIALTATVCHFIYTSVFFDANSPDFNKVK